jgi:hypothetical protein
MKIGLILDGRSEIKALGNQVRNVEIRKRPSNGITVSIDQIANESVKLLKALGSAGCVKKILVIDRENRTHSATKIGEQLKKLIAKNTAEDFVVVVADRMFENWILADIESVSGKHSDRLKKTSNSMDFEGCHGKSELKNKLKDGHRYKTEDAEPFFKAVKADVAVMNSASYKKWMEALNQFGAVLNYGVSPDDRE